MTQRLMLSLIALAVLLPAGSAVAKKRKQTAEPPAPQVAYRADQQPGTDLQVIKGEGAYSICSGCHGEQGEGVVGLAPRLNSQPWLTAVSNDFIRTTIKEGRDGSNMVPWYEGLGDEALDGLVAYIRSWQTEDGVELDESELKGDVDTGARLFVDVCSSCHGVKGAGYRAGLNGIGIGRKGFLDLASNGFLRRMIREGKTGTPMRSFSEDSAYPAQELTAEQIDSIIQYLRANAW